MLHYSFRLRPPKGAPASQVTSAVPEPSVSLGTGGGASRWHTARGTAPTGLGMSSTCPQSASRTIPWAHPLTSSLGITCRSESRFYCSDPTHCHLRPGTDDELSGAHFLPLFCKPVQAAARPRPRRTPFRCCHSPQPAGQGLGSFLKPAEMKPRRSPLQHGMCLPVLPSSTGQGLQAARSPAVLQGQHPAMHRAALSTSC